MRKLFIPLFFAMLLVGVTLGLLRFANAQAQASSPEVIVERQVGTDNVREAQVFNASAPNQPDIGFIDSPTAACTQPDYTKNECFINWYYLSVSADPNYMIAMTVTLNTIGPMARYNGFFQTSMYAPFNMNPQGYKVACGALGSGGIPTMGAAYAYTIRARDSSNLSSSNYGTVNCPAFAP